jgi:hypothetical protein
MASKIGWSKRMLNPAAIHVSLCEISLFFVVKVSLRPDIVNAGIPCSTSGNLTATFPCGTKNDHDGPSAIQRRSPSAMYQPVVFICHTNFEKDGMSPVLGMFALMAFVYAR